MGGRLTSIVSIDPRIKASSPSVGGTGFLYKDLPGLPGSARRMQADIPLYQATISSQSYWPLVKTPVLYLSASNDFNAPMELAFRGLRLIPQDNWVPSFTPPLEPPFHQRQLRSPHSLV